MGVQVFGLKEGSGGRSIAATRTLAFEKDAHQYALSVAAFGQRHAYEPHWIDAVFHLC